MASDIIVWNDAFLWGIPELDQDHRRVVDTLNRLNVMLRDGASVDEFLAEADGLVPLLKKHLDRERVIMEAGLDDSGRAALVREHADVEARLTEAHAAFAKAHDVAAAAPFLAFLHQWLLDHLLDLDVGLRERLAAKGVVKAKIERHGWLESAMERLHLRTRILAIATVPVLALAGTSGTLIQEKRAQAESMAVMHGYATAASQISNLVFELQKERGLSGGYLGAEGDKFTERVTSQRKLTDARLAEAQGALERLVREPGLADAAAAARGDLTRLAAVRGAVTARSIPAAEAVAHYTTSNEHLIGIVAAMGRTTDNAALANGFLAYASAINTAERAGLERALGTAAFGAGVFQGDTFQRFLGLVGEQRAYIDTFNGLASAELKRKLDATLRSEAFTEVNKLRKVAIEGNLAGSLGQSGVGSGRWFDAVSAEIELLKKVQDDAATWLTATAASHETSAERAFAAVSAITAIMVALTTLMVVLMIRGIVRPLHLLRDSLARLGQGDTAVIIAGLGKRDLVGDIARAVQAFKNGILKSAGAAARAGIDQSLRERRAHERERLVRAFEGQIDGFLAAVGRSVEALERSATTLSGAMEQGRAQAAAVAAAASQATSNVESVAVSVEELASSVQEIARQTEQSARVADDATSNAASARDTVRGLSEAAGRIGEVVTLIQTIAKQTNLLALNATIEAARAGEHGKGFAVVAQEVKTLASQTGGATGDIQAQVDAIQAETGRAVTTIGVVDTVVHDMSDIAATVAAALSEQDATTREISRNVAQAAHGTRDVSSNIEGVAHAADEAMRLASVVSEAAQAVSAETDTLRSKVQAFLVAMNKD